MYLGNLLRNLGNKLLNLGSYLGTLSSQLPGFKIIEYNLEVIIFLAVLGVICSSVHNA